jgi:hypothetical protein
MPVTLPLAKSKIEYDFATKTTLLYGPPKIGKSTFASKFPNALFFECEPGLSSLEVFKIPTYNWLDLLEACKLVAAGNHPYKTIVIDTVDNAFKYCSDHVNAVHKIEYEGDLGHGKGWAFVKNEWHRVLTRLASLPYGLILISHAQEREVETRTGKYNRTAPSLPERARNVVLGMADMILFADAAAIKDADGSLATQRVLRAKPNPLYEAGDRTGRLPDTLSLDFEAFSKAFETKDKKPQAPVSVASAATTKQEATK